MQESSFELTGVDSRGARRQIQEELPLEIYDASTTGIDEVVFHYNSAVTDRACLGCIYPQTPEEASFERHVARKLNVSVTEVRSGYITAAAAQRILGRYPQLRTDDLVGLAYDSLFKRLCSTQELIGPEQRQVLAPFACVSQLAGTVLAIEMYLRRSGLRPPDSFNYWRLRPWSTPNYDLRSDRPRLSTCSVCSDPTYHAVASELWRHA